MEIATIELALGGDAGHTVRKSEVTAAEIAVLRAIHGESAVFDVTPTGRIIRSNKEELERIFTLYGKAQNHEGEAVIAKMFPGVGARVLTTLAELGLPINFFAPKVQVAMENAEEAVAEAEEAEEVEDVKPAPVKKGRAKKVEPVAEAEPAETDLLG